MDWLRHYAFGLCIGVLFIFVAGFISQNSPGNAVGLAVSPQVAADSFAQTNDERDVRLIIKNCEVTPKEVYASHGDKLIISAQVRDSPRLHNLVIPKHTELKVKGSDIAISEVFTAGPGKYPISISYPCNTGAVSTLIVR